MTFKQKINEQFLELITNQVNGYKQTLVELAESAANETKSTAGDKHETALAMLQIEQRNIKGRLSESEEQKKLLEAVNTESVSNTIKKGSLVKTNLGYFFLAVALGKIEVDGVTIMAISPQSPLGSQLIGLQVKGRLQVNKNNYIIEQID